MNKDHRLPATVDRYIAGFPRDIQQVLTVLRRTIRKAIPDAAEGISYGMPTYKLNDRHVIYFAGWKHHYSIYPVTGRLIEVFKDDLSPYEVNGKGTIRFPLTEPVPERLIEAIAKFRAKDVVGRGKTKTASSRRG